MGRRLGEWATVAVVTGADALGAGVLAAGVSATTVVTVIASPATIRKRLTADPAINCSQSAAKRLSSAERIFLLSETDRRFCWRTMTVRVGDSTERQESNGDCCELVLPSNTFRREKKRITVCLIIWKTL